MVHEGEFLPLPVVSEYKLEALGRATLMALKYDDGMRVENEGCTVVFLCIIITLNIV